jgi:hypothetical protein
MAREVADQTAYAASYRDPVRAVNPFTPTELVTDGSTTTMPIIGVAVVAGAILLLEHFRRKRSR